MNPKSPEMLSLRNFWGFLLLLVCYRFSVNFIILTDLWYFSTGQVFCDHRSACLRLLIYGVCEIFKIHGVEQFLFSLAIQLQLQGWRFPISNSAFEYKKVWGCAISKAVIYLSLFYFIRSWGYFFILRRGDEMPGKKDIVADIRLNGEKSLHLHKM